MLRGARRLNPAWAINTGLIMRLAPSPGGVLRWYDLVTGTPYYLQTWTTGARPVPMPGGKLGMGIHSNATQDGFLLGSHPKVSTAYSTWSAAIWYIDMTSSTTPVLMANTSTDTLIQLNRSGSNVTVNCFVGGGSKVFSGLTFPVGKLVRILVTGDGTNVRGYINGQLAGTVAFAGTVRPPSRIGNYTSVASQYRPTGYMSDACFWSRTISATGAMADYIDGLAGHQQAFTGLTLPGMLSASPVITSFQRPWFGAQTRSL